MNSNDIKDYLFLNGDCIFFFGGINNVFNVFFLWLKVKKFI